MRIGIPVLITSALAVGCGSVSNSNPDAPIVADDDAAMPDAAPDSIVQIAAGSSHTCVVYGSGSLRCWGANNVGQLGQGNTDDIGDSESPSAVPPVPVGAPVRQVAVGEGFTCALLEGGDLKCWGGGRNGVLGYGNINDLGDDESVSTIGLVDVGGAATAISAGFDHVCAIVGNGALRCWGAGSHGQLGYANTNTIGDNELPAAAGNVNVGDAVTRISACAGVTCAVTMQGGARCWGQNLLGVLGYPGQGQDIGDNEPPAFMGDIPLGGTATSVACGVVDACAVMTGGGVRCWGDNAFGQLGYGNTNTIGDNEPPSAAGDVALGGPVVEVHVGNTNACARTSGGDVRCWGYGPLGALGYGNTNNIGDNEQPASTAAVDVGGPVRLLSAHDGVHVCAVLEAGGVRCWGTSTNGQLGYGNTVTIGDNETPASAGDVDVGGP